MKTIIVGAGAVLFIAGGSLAVANGYQAHQHTVAAQNASQLSAVQHQVTSLQNDKTALCGYIGQSRTVLAKSKISLAIPTQCE